MDEPQEMQEQPVPQPTDEQSELETLQAQAQEFLDGWKRAQADYQNLKRETEKEKVELAKFTNLSMILELLPVVDNFNRAMRHLPSNGSADEWIKGIQAIHQQLKSVLAGMGVEEISTSGMFDPALHESLSDEEREGVAAHTILEVLEPGYMLHGKVLRAAKVKISK